MVRRSQLTGSDIPKTKMYDGKRYTKDVTRLSWSGLRNRIDTLRKDGWNVRYIEWQHKSATPRIRYTIYKRRRQRRRK